MTQRNNLYRRSSGIYVLRITVPARYRAYFSQREIHASTQTTDFLTAKSVALRLLAGWHSCIGELDVDEQKVIDGSPLLAGAGRISIQDFSEAFDVKPKLVLEETLNNNIPISCSVNSEQMYWIEDHLKIEREDDTGGFVLDRAIRTGILQIFTGTLKPYHPRITISNLIASGFSDECVFLTHSTDRTALFCDLPGIRITTSTTFITKLQAGRIREQWASSLTKKMPTLISPPPGTSPTSTVASAPVTTTAIATVALPAPWLPSTGLRFCNPVFSGMATSSLVRKFLDHKAPGWGLDQQKKMSTVCGCFVELMGDPSLGAIDRELIRNYESKLRLMPSNRYQAARRHGTNDASMLLVFAEKNNEPRLSEKTVESYLGKLSEVFRWAVTEDYFGKNPADKIIRKTRGVKTRAQDDRHPFDHDDLTSIFSAEWFAHGGAKRNKGGGLSDFRPYYYWLPLLGLYTGARLNEISQLHLTDIIEYEEGKFCAFINEQTITTDETKIADKAVDKSIKNDDSKRLIPIHSNLIELGFSEYIDLLKTNGHTRLFPELRYDRVKGYGKAAGAWFNERFLGTQLKMRRDGMKTFHSFRHTLITALVDKGTPETVISAIAGHTRGDTTSLKRYSKDAAARSQPYLDSLDFKLPLITRFNSKTALIGVKQALHRRKTNPNKAL